MAQLLSQAEWAVKKLQAVWLGLEFNPANLPTKFELKRIEQSAQKDWGINPGLASSVLGHIAVLRHDPTAMCLHFEQAVRVSPNDSSVRFNYGMGLWRFGNFQKAHDQIEMAVQWQETNNVFLRGMISCCLAQGRFQEALQCVERYRRLQPDTVKQGITELEDAVSLLERHRITDDDVGAFLTHVGDLLWKKKLPLIQVKQELFFEGDDHWIGLRYDLLCSIEKTVELEWELAGKLPGGSDSMKESDPQRWLVVDFRGAWSENGR